jgi:hypothetical protein
MRIFLCHASSDKPDVRDLYRRLCADGFQPWLDEQDLLPGQSWMEEIPKAIHSSAAVIVCLSPASISKEGYLQKEIRYALDVADEKPEGTIFIIPLKLKECDVPPRLSQWQSANLYEPDGYQRLLRGLRERAKAIEFHNPAAGAPGLVRLRREASIVSTNQAKAMVARHNFYRASWNESGKGICHQYEMKIIQDALLVIDHATGLAWQKGGSGRDLIRGSAAAGYSGELNRQKFAGFTDWRLPTLEEAMSLMTTEKDGTPRELMYGNEKVKGVMHLDPVFDIEEAPMMWTSDSQSPDNRWVVYFWDAICSPESLDFHAYVRAVRTWRSESV